MFIHSAAAPEIALANLTIENSQANPAISVENNTALTVSQCVFQGNNDSSGITSCVFVGFGTANFTHCVFDNNTGFDTVEFDGDSGSFTDCSFTDNAILGGVGQISGNTGNVTVSDCTFSGNSVGSNGLGGASFG